MGFNCDFKGDKIETSLAYADLNSNQVCLIRRTALFCKAFTSYKYNIQHRGTKLFNPCVAELNN